MDLLTFIVVVALIGIVMFFVNKLPMEANVKQFLNIAVVLLLVLWLVSLVAPNLRLPRL